MIDMQEFYMQKVAANMLKSAAVVSPIGAKLLPEDRSKTGMSHSEEMDLIDSVAPKPVYTPEEQDVAYEADKLLTPMNPAEAKAKSLQQKGDDKYKTTLSNYEEGLKNAQKFASKKGGVDPNRQQRGEKNIKYFKDRIAKLKADKKNIYQTGEWKDPIVDAALKKDQDEIVRRRLVSQNLGTDRQDTKDDSLLRYWWAKSNALGFGNKENSQQYVNKVDRLNSLYRDDYEQGNHEPGIYEVNKRVSKREKDFQDIVDQTASPMGHGNDKKVMQVLTSLEEVNSAIDSMSNRKDQPGVLDQINRLRETRKELQDSLYKEQSFINEANSKNEKALPPGTERTLGDWGKRIGDMWNWVGNNPIKSATAAYILYNMFSGGGGGGYQMGPMGGYQMGPMGGGGGNVVTNHPYLSTAALGAAGYLANEGTFGGVGEGWFTNLMGADKTPAKPVETPAEKRQRDEAKAREDALKETEKKTTPVPKAE